MATSATSATYICCRCIDKEDTYTNMIFCRLCKLSAVCKKCFSFMERNYDANEMKCPVCCQIYYGELRNSIVKYALEYSIGMNTLSGSLLQLWKRNSIY